MSEPTRTTNQRLMLAAAQAGDEQAFRRLVEPYRHALHVHCYRMLGSAQDAEDLAQETLLRAWRALERRDGAGAGARDSAAPRAPTPGFDLPRRARLERARGG